MSPLFKRLQERELAPIKAVKFDGTQEDVDRIRHELGFVCTLHHAGGSHIHLPKGAGRADAGDWVVLLDPESAPTVWLAEDFEHKFFWVANVTPTPGRLQAELRRAHEEVEGLPKWAGGKGNRWAAFTSDELFTLACASSSMIGIGSQARHLEAEIRAEMDRRESERPPEPKSKVRRFRGPVGEVEAVKFDGSSESIRQIRNFGWQVVVHKAPSGHHLHFENGDGGRGRANLGDYVFCITRGGGVYVDKPAAFEANYKEIDMPTEEQCPPARWQREPQEVLEVLNREQVIKILATGLASAAAQVLIDAGLEVGDDVSVQLWIGRDADCGITIARLASDGVWR